MTVDCLHWFVDGPILSIISHPGIAWSNSNKKRVPVDEGVRVPGHEDHGGWRGWSWRSWGWWGGRRWWRKEIQLTPQGFHRLQRSSTCSAPRTPPGTQTEEQINSLQGMIKFAMEGDTTKMTRRLIVPLPPEALCYSALPWPAAPWVNIFHETCRTGAQACKHFW